MLGPYSISKTALFGLAKVLSQELAIDHIRVNCLAPGLIKTKFSSAVSVIIIVINALIYALVLRTLAQLAQAPPLTPTL